MLSSLAATVCYGLIRFTSLFLLFLMSFLLCLLLFSQRNAAAFVLFVFSIYLMQISQAL